tara:strand:+ start:531 stop:1397 length:867 start_codon:yes stop_codon:yes gene_type:complete
MDNQTAPPETKETKKNKDWSDKLTKYAAWGTGGYFLILAGLLFGRYDQLWTKDINELGDFLAGAFGPVAFLWLVIGYLMQHSELKLNRISIEKQALELEFTRLAYEQQIEEFKKSVEVTKDASDFNKDMQRQLYKESVEPYQPRIVDVTLGEYKLLGAESAGPIGLTAFHLRGLYIIFSNDGQRVKNCSFYSQLMKSDICSGLLNDEKVLNGGPCKIGANYKNINYKLAENNFKHSYENDEVLDVIELRYTDAKDIRRVIRFELLSRLEVNQGLILSVRLQPPEWLEG